MSSKQTYSYEIKMKAIEMKLAQVLVKEKGVIMSMSRKGTPSDNAIIETFYLEGLLKTTNQIVIKTVQEYINYYHHARILAKLNDLSPVAYRKKMVS